MRLLVQPKGVLLAVSLLIIAQSLLIANATLDLHLYDTYFIIGNFHAGLFFLLEAGVYFLTDNYRQWRSIQWFHVISIGFFVLMAMVWNKIPDVLLTLFLLGQILFIINLIAGFIRGKKVLNHVR